MYIEEEGIGGREVSVGARVDDGAGAVLALSSLSRFLRFNSIENSDRFFIHASRVRRALSSCGISLVLESEQSRGFLGRDGDFLLFDVLIQSQSA